MFKLNKSLSKLMVTTAIVAAITTCNFETVKADVLAPYQITADVYKICKDRSVEPELILSMIEHESTFNPHAKNGTHYGLMQVNPTWHANRMAEYGVTDLYDPYGNIEVGSDYVEYLINQYHDVALALMVYNMGDETALRLYKKGKISSYARNVMERVAELKSIYAHDVEATITVTQPLPDPVVIEGVGKSYTQYLMTVKENEENEY